MFRASNSFCDSLKATKYCLVKIFAMMAMKICVWCTNTNIENDLENSNVNSCFLFITMCVYHVSFCVWNLFWERKTIQWKVRELNIVGKFYKTTMIHLVKPINDLMQWTITLPLQTNSIFFYPSIRTLIDFSSLNLVLTSRLLFFYISWPVTIGEKNLDYQTQHTRMSNLNTNCW